MEQLQEASVGSQIFRAEREMRYRLTCQLHSAGHSGQNVWLLAQNQQLSSSGVGGRLGPSGCRARAGAPHRHPKGRLPQHSAPEIHSKVFSVLLVFWSTYCQLLLCFVNLKCNFQMAFWSWGCKRSKWDFPIKNIRTTIAQSWVASSPVATPFSFVEPPLLHWWRPVLKDFFLRKCLHKLCLPLGAPHIYAFVF